MAGHNAPLMDCAPQSRRCSSDLQIDEWHRNSWYHSRQGRWGWKGAFLVSLFLVASYSCEVLSWNSQDRQSQISQMWPASFNRESSAYGRHRIQKGGLQGSLAFAHQLRPVIKPMDRVLCRPPLVRLRDAATSSRFQPELRLPVGVKTLQGSTGSGTETTEETNLEEMLEAQAKSALWGNWTEAQVKEATLLWIEQVVIGMKLCPFAMEAMGGLRIAVSEAQDFEMALDKFDVELKWLVGLDKDHACTMIVYPPSLFEPLAAPEAADNQTVCEVEETEEEADLGEKDCTTPGRCTNFEAFMSLAKQESDMAQYLNAARGQDIESETLLLTFHPRSQFGDVDDDPADFALRSPFPTVLLLRGCDVREAEDVCEEQGRVTEDIAIANEARLRQVGYAELAAALDSIWNAARDGRAVQLIEAAQEERERAAEEASRAALMEAGEWGGGYDGVDGIDGLDETYVKPIEIQDGNLDYAGLDGRLSLLEDEEEEEEEREGAAAALEGGGGGLDAEGVQREEEEEEEEAAKEILEPFDPFGYAVTADEVEKGPLLDEDEFLGGSGDKRGGGI